MAKITYLLGAGASALALPVIKKGPESKAANLNSELARYVESYRQQPNKAVEIEQKLNYIVRSCAEFGTPDLCAKHFNETNDLSNYNILKSLISSYFSYMQHFSQIGAQGFDKNKNDPRVLSFLTTITGNNRLSEDINIISWNYDLQFETAAKRLGSTQIFRKTIPGFVCWPNFPDSDNSTYAKEDIFLLHLNGVAAYNYVEDGMAKKNSDVFYFTEKNDTLLSFAWENYSTDKRELFIPDRIGLAKQMVAETEYLVVIGYSFPYFNREIDRAMFNALKRPGLGLKKIYVQDPYTDWEYLRVQFDLGDYLNIIPIENTDNYFIPYEF